jgi:hypothetical protein
MARCEIPDTRALAAIEILASLELSDLVYWTITILKVPFGEQTIDPSAVACSYAVTKAELYIEAVGQAEARRYDIGMSVRRELEAAEALRDTDPEAAATLSHDAIRRNDKTEVEIHLFTICADQVRRMLAIVTEALGLSLDDDDERFLASYRPLRNQFEHLEERLPGVESGGSIVLNEARIPSVLLGLRKDDVGRIFVQHRGEDVVAEVNNVGQWHIERIARETFDKIREKCVGLLVQHFAEHPEEVIEPGFYTHPMVRRRLLDGSEPG